MSFRRWVRRGLVVIGAAISSACGILEPCETPLNLTMDGTWQLIAVNGDPIPSVGYPLPFPSTDRLKAGAIRFATLKALGCKGDDEIKSSGRAVAYYYLINAQGQLKPNKSYAGSFEYQHKEAVVTLKAFSQSVSGDVFANEFTVAPNNPLFGTYVLTFRRIVQF